MTAVLVAGVIFNGGGALSLLNFLAEGKGLAAFALPPETCSMIIVGVDMVLFFVFGALRVVLVVIFVVAEDEELLLFSMSLVEASVWLCLAAISFFCCSLMALESSIVDFCSLSKLLWFKPGLKMSTAISCILELFLSKESAEGLCFCLGFDFGFWSGIATVTWMKY